LAQIRTKLFSGWGFAPDPTGELTALPKPLASKGKGNERNGRGGEGRNRKGGRGNEGTLPPLKFKSSYALGLRVMSVNSL